MLRGHCWPPFDVTVSALRGLHPPFRVLHKPSSGGPAHRPISDVYPPPATPTLPAPKPPAPHSNANPSASPAEADDSGAAPPVAAADLATIAKSSGFRFANTSRVSRSAGASMGAIYCGSAFSIRDGAALPSGCRTKFSTAMSSSVSMPLMNALTRRPVRRSTGSMNSRTDAC
jgi:hypothetical protein